MNSLSHQLRRLFAAILLISGLCFVPSTPLYSAKPLSQANPVQIQNRTTAFKILSINKESHSIQGLETILIKLRNDSDKTITSYLIATSESTTEQTDFTFSETEGITGIAPGAVTEWRKPTNPDLLQEGIVILAVLFEDGTGDGDPQRIRGMQEQLYGYKLQLTRILNIMDNLLNSPVADTTKALDELEVQVNGLSTEPPDEKQEQVKIGLHNQKYSTLYKVKELRQRLQEPEKDTIREALAQLQTRLKKQLSKIHLAKSTS